MNKMVKCEGCGRLFYPRVRLVSTHGVLTLAYDVRMKYHSKACKQKAYRSRMAKRRVMPKYA